MKAASAQKGPLLSHDFSLSEILVRELRCRDKPFLRQE